MVTEGRVPARSYRKDFLAIKDTMAPRKKKNLSGYDSTSVPSAAGKKFGVIVAEWNREITEALLSGTLSTLKKHGAQEKNIFLVRVPGSFELPSAAALLARKKKPDAVICIGCVIEGETRHFEFICSAVSQGLVNLSLLTGIPCIFGVLTPRNMKQALERAGGRHGNKGVEAAVTALQMAHFASLHPSPYGEGEKKRRKKK
jgi:6,7-dimethyl-8-ribityllumazine synthase